MRTARGKEEKREGEKEDETKKRREEEKRREGRKREKSTESKEMKRKNEDEEMKRRRGVGRRNKEEGRRENVTCVRKKKEGNKKRRKRREKGRRERKGSNKRRKRREGKEKERKEEGTDYHEKKKSKTLTVPVPRLGAPWRVPPQLLANIAQLPAHFFLPTNTLLAQHLLQRQPLQVQDVAGVVLGQRALEAPRQARHRVQQRGAQGARKARHVPRNGVPLQGGDVPRGEEQAQQRGGARRQVAGAGGLAAGLAGEHAQAAQQGGAVLQLGPHEDDVVLQGGVAVGVALPAHHQARQLRDLHLLRLQQQFYEEFRGKRKRKKRDEEERGKGKKRRERK